MKTEQTQTSRKLFLLATFTCVSAIVTANSVAAQGVAPPVDPLPADPAVVPFSDPGYAPAVRYPDSGFSFFDHSSTAAEGYLRGAGAYLRGLGDLNLSNSLANMNNQEAIRRSLENTLKYAETYYAKRDLWFDYKEAHSRKPLTMEGYRKLAAAAGADRLTSDQYDSNSGKVMWPNLLQAKVLDPYRDRVDKALGNRSITGNGLGSETYEIVRQMTESMQEILDRHRKTLPSHLYVDATKFLDSVRYEARFAPPSADVGIEDGSE